MNALQVNNFTQSLWSWHEANISNLKRRLDF